MVAGCRARLAVPFRQAQRGALVARRAPPSSARPIERSVPGTTKPSLSESIPAHGTRQRRPREDMLMTGGLHFREFSISGGRVLKTTPVFDTYWRFAAKRQDVFMRRISGAPGPWT